MSKQYNIRWSENDLKELNRSVKNFNAKVKRLETKYKNSDVILPEKVSVKELKEIVTTRRDLQRELKSLQRFTQRGSEEVVKAPNTDNNLNMTKWQRTEMLRRANTINQRRVQRKSEIVGTELYRRGESLGYTKGDIGMGNRAELSYTPTKAFTRKMSKYDLREKYRMLRKESQSVYWDQRDLQLRENYVNALRDNFKEEDIKEVIDHINNMDIKDFKKQLFENPEDFETAYPPDDEQYKGYVTELYSMWKPNKKPNTKKRAGKR